MLCKQMLAGLCLGLASVAFAQGQPGLGTPVAPEITPSAVECAAKARRPIFGNLARTLLTPFRPAPELLPPQPIVETMPTKEDIARMVADGNFSPAEITAAKIRVDEAQAKARQAAVRYLATVDCNYYPEAEAGLIAALRADRSEGVRFEAAVALGTCRGTTKKIVDALNLTVQGQDLDGNPPESSERVRQAARTSLNRALSSNLMAVPMDLSLTPPMMPFPPTWEWHDPYAMMPVNYYQPLPTYPLAVPPATPQERERAETVSTSVKAPPPTPMHAPRSVVEWFQNFSASRSAAATAASTSKNIDPRLRGLSPLGSQTQLSIPASPSLPMSPSALPAYNNDR